MGKEAENSARYACVGEAQNRSVVRIEAGAPEKLADDSRGGSVT